MITTAFLLKVIIYGLIAAVIIPAIDFVIFVVREGRRSRAAELRGWRTDTDERAEEPVRRQPPARQLRQREPLTTTGSTTVPSGRQAQESSRRPVERATTPAAKNDRLIYNPYAPGGYVASNGITVTPNPLGRSSKDDEPDVSPRHPHAEYWCYGSPRFYEGR